MSLIEATIILAVLAFLTAMTAPSMRAYVRDAQDTKAVTDAKTIGSALERMLTDVGETAVLRDGNGSASTDPPSHASSNLVDLLVSDGSTPTLTVSRATPNSNGTDWTTSVNNTFVQKLSYFLATNTPSNTSANAYRGPSQMSVSSHFDPTSGSTFNSEYAWRGAYLTSIGPDPWGNRYAVNVEFLQHPLGTGPSGNVNDVYVVSAGNNGTVDTRYDVDGVTPGSDDVVYVISGGTR
jgi:type II secretory pathway pseudopilin PulG